MGNWEYFGLMTPFLTGDGAHLGGISMCFFWGMAKLRWIDATFHIHIVWVSDMTIAIPREPKPWDTSPNPTTKKWMKAGGKICVKHGEIKQMMVFF